MSTKKPRLTITLDPQTYKQIQNIAKKENLKMSVVCRDLVNKSLNTDLTKENLDFICCLLREQMRNTIDPYMKRIAAMSSKSCIQAGTAAYLSAETISRLLPENKKMDYFEAYGKARQKAILYLKNKVDEK